MLLRKLPAFKGKYRLVKALFYSKIQAARDIIVEGKLNIRYKLPNLKESLAFAIYANGIYEERNIRFIADKIEKNGVMLDLGANIGSISIPIARLRPDVKIICVEASPRVFSYLKTNVELNGISNITIVNKALSDVDDETVSFYSPEEKFGKGSMSAVFTKNAETVKTITVDSLIREHGVSKVGFIKTDVEGYESYVFRGAKMLLSKPHSPDILFEFAHWSENQAKNTEKGDAQRVLLSYGYSLYTIDHPPKTEKIEQPLTTSTHMILATKNV